MLGPFSQTTTVGIRVDVVEALDPVEVAVAHALQGERPWLMTFVNPGSTIVARQHPDYAEMLREFDVVVPDGIGMSLAIRLLHRRHAARISFDTTSLAPVVFRLAARRGARIVLAGGRPGVAERARTQLEREFPGINVVATFDGYADRATTIDTIRALAPDIIVCGMGSIVQENFLLQLVKVGWRGVGFTCGGYLDQLNGGINYYPKIIDKWNLRWAYRLCREPRRLGRRYLLDYPAFGLALCRALGAAGVHALTQR
ncbi:MAG: WecB/TagA/CpsF family glycosyltransferase [Acetobacteraceae bacterium]|nr:WecB/TagA/CpsF family glycosyltransferase [Acetobacteraceae bacterium]